VRGLWESLKSYYDTIKAAMAITEKYLEAWGELNRILTRGVRPKTFKGLIWLCFYLRNYRFEDVWGELKARSGEDHLKRNFGNYLTLAVRDKEEIEHVAKWLGVSRRTAIDYLKALERLAIFGFGIW